MLGALLFERVSPCEQHSHVTPGGTAPCSPLPSSSRMAGLSEQPPSPSLELLSMLRSDRGIALLEVLVALAVLSGAGLALLDLVTGGLRAERDARERERVLAVEERVLTALTLLKRDELDHRLGHHPIGELIVEIQRPERPLYRIAVSQQESSQVEDLVTVVYRREPRHGP